PAILRDRHRCDGFGMTYQGTDELSGDGVPYMDQFVGIAADGARCVGGNGDLERPEPLRLPDSRRGLGRNVDDRHGLQPTTPQEQPPPVPSPSHTDGSERV